MSSFVPRFRAKVEGSEIKFATDYNAARFRDYLRSLDGKQVVVTVQRKTTQRSNKQNNYYWGAILPLIAEHIGESVEETHHLMVGMFLVRERHLKAVDKETGEVLKTSNVVIPYLPSTTELTVGEFQEYLMKMELWAIEFLGIQRFPDPDEWELRDLMI